MRALDSGLPATAHTPAEAVNDLVVLIEHLGDPVDVLGFSYGGQLAQRLLVTTPEKVRRTVIASSSILPVPPDAFVGWSEREGRLARAGAPDDDEACDDERTRRDAVRSAVTDLWRQELLPKYLSRLALVHFSSDWSHAWPDRSKFPPARPEQVVDRLRKLGKPLLLLHGRQDMTFPADLVEPTAELIATARGVVLERRDTWPTSTNLTPGSPPFAPSSTPRTTSPMALPTAGSRSRLTGRANLLKAAATLLPRGGIRARLPEHGPQSSARTR